MVSSGGAESVDAAQLALSMLRYVLFFLGVPVAALALGVGLSGALLRKRLTTWQAAVISFMVDAPSRQLRTLLRTWQ